MTVLISGRLCRGSAVVFSATRTPVPLVTQDVLRNQGTCLPILSNTTAQVRSGQPHPVSLEGVREHSTTKPSRLRGNPGQGRTEVTSPSYKLITLLYNWGCLLRSRERSPFIRVRSGIYNTWSRSPLILAMQALVPALSGSPSSERSARRKLWYSEYCVYTVLIRANTPSSRGTSNSRCREGTNQDRFSAAGMGCRAVCLLRARETSAMDNSMFQRSHPN
jgi:hypothetical protein